MSLKVLIVFEASSDSFKSQFVNALLEKKSYTEKIWEARLVDIGEDWQDRINDSLDVCVAAFLFVTPAFLKTDFFGSTAWNRFLQRVEKKEVAVRVFKTFPCELPLKFLSGCQIIPSNGACLNDKFYGPADLFLEIADWFETLVREVAESHPSMRWQKAPVQFQKILLKNFRCFPELEIHLDRSLNVFVGDNGAGKSALLEAISLAQDAIVSFFLDSPLRKISASDFRTLSDGTSAPTATVEATTFHGLSWFRFEQTEASRAHQTGGFGFNRLSDLHDHLREIRDTAEIPLMVQYGIQRESFNFNSGSSGSHVPGNRFEALRQVNGGSMDFSLARQWFCEQEERELRLQRQRRDFNFTLPVLDAVRKAMESMFPDVTNLHTKDLTGELWVDRKTSGGVSIPLSFNQLSDGYRGMLALVMDLARRMVQGNPYMSDPLSSHAVVLIDEVDLHLHPKWQQHVLLDLRRTFPNTQFIVTTHSPQVLTTVEPQHIQIIRWSGEQVELLHPRSSVGAESGRLLQDIQGVDPRPPEVEFTRLLKEYLDSVAQGRGREPDALEKRKRLDDWARGEDPALVRADMELRRQELFGR
ncbi:MAG: AAA family ATPase [Magnetococcales bacterium]|nr:AAA family ATPase [Magnetococcales bacterium]